MALTVKQIDSLRGKVLNAIHPLQPATLRNYFYGERTTAGRGLPEYYLVYFTLVDLLHFQKLGQQEKVAWSIPLKLHETVFIVEHRKMGLGIFVRNRATEEDLAREACELICSAVQAATPYFEHIAEKAVADSRLNVRNNSRHLFERFEGILALYRKRFAQEKTMRAIFEKPVSSGAYRSRMQLLSRMYKAAREASWLALAAIEAFFSWTEHVFIHLAVLQGFISTGQEVASSARMDWADKFKQAIDLKEPTMKRLYDDLSALRRQVRNYVAHGAFGKQGEAFAFHSAVGAVPVFLPHQARQNRFTLLGDLSFRDEDAVDLLEQFVRHLWAGPMKPALHYLHKSDLPTILPLAQNGTYKGAIQSMAAMERLIEQKRAQFDRAADMDW